MLSLARSLRGPSTKDLPSVTHGITFGSFKPAENALSPLEKILACFAKKEGLKLSEIANLSGESIAQVNVTVVQLELKHCLSKNMDGRYEAKIG